MTDNEFVALQRTDGSTIAVLGSQTLAVYLESAEAAKWLGQSGFVSDIYLATVDADTTTCALELELEGLWFRIDVGYYAVDDRTSIAALGDPPPLRGVRRGRGGSPPFGA